VARDRLIESKKPWAVVAMLGLLVAALVNFLGIFIAWNSYSPELFAEAFKRVEAVTTRSAGIHSSLEQARMAQTDILAVQQRILRLADRRFQVLGLMRAIEQMLPYDEPDKSQPLPDKDDAEQPEQQSLINYDELHIDSLECEYFEDLEVWFEPLEAEWQKTVARDQPAPRQPEAADPAAAESGAPDAAAAADDSAIDPADGIEDENLESDEPARPTGAGWVIQLAGHHFHNEDRHKPFEGRYYLRTTIIEKLLEEDGDVGLTVAAGPRQGEPISVAELGIGYPVIVKSSTIQNEWLSLDTGSSLDGSPEMGPRPATRRSRRSRRRPGVEAGGQDGIELKRYDFVLQFVWQPRTPGALALVPDESEDAGNSGY